MLTSRRGAHRDRCLRKQKRASGLSGCATAPLRWIVVAGSVVVPHRRSEETRDRGHAVANVDMSRMGVMHPCGVGSSAQGEQKTKGQNKTHRISSNQTRPSRDVVPRPQRGNLGRLRRRSNFRDQAKLQDGPSDNHCWQARRCAQAAGVRRGLSMEVGRGLDQCPIDAHNSPVMRQRVSKQIY